MTRLLSLIARIFPSAPKSVPPTPWLPAQREPDAWQMVCRSAMRQAQISEEVRRSADSRLAVDPFHRVGTRSLEGPDAADWVPQ